MKIDGKDFRTIWEGSDGLSVNVIDQRALPHRLVIAKLSALEDFATAIREMWVRGAPLIGVTAAYGLAFALRCNAGDAALNAAYELLLRTRPTAINLRWALDFIRRESLKEPFARRAEHAWNLARILADKDVEANASIGAAGLDLIGSISTRKSGRAVNILTHCNAGWLGTVDIGTATAPIYAAKTAGIAVHVFVDETRPRNQGAQLTAWELFHAGVEHTLIVDNAGGHLMQAGQVDLVLVGCDRVAANGDVCNKVGTYLKALAAADNGVPFYVACPTSTVDFELALGVNKIPIEDRGPDEVLYVQGKLSNGEMGAVQIAPSGTRCANPGFDVTPARLVDGYLTERGLFKDPLSARLDMRSASGERHHDFRGA